MDELKRVNELSKLRVLADEFGDPNLYRLLADWYREIGFEANATACEQRAAHYSRKEDADACCPA